MGGYCLFIFIISREGEKWVYSASYLSICSLEGVNTCDLIYPLMYNKAHEGGGHAVMDTQPTARHTHHKCSAHAHTYICRQVTTALV